MPESLHSSGNEPLLPTHNAHGQHTNPGLTTAEAAALESAAGRPLPGTPPSEGYPAIRPISGPYPAPISPIGLGGPYSPLEASYPQRGSPSAEHPQRVPSGSRTNSRRVVSGANYFEGQDITDQPAIPEERRVVGTSGLSRRVTTVPQKTASEEDEKHAMGWIVPQVGGGLSRGVSMYAEKQVRC